LHLLVAYVVILVMHRHTNIKLQFNIYIPIQYDAVMYLTSFRLDTDSSQMQLTSLAVCSETSADSYSLCALQVYKYSTENSNPIIS